MCLRNEIKKIRQLSLRKVVFFLLIILGMVLRKKIVFCE